MLWGSSSHSISDECYRTNPRIPLFASEQRTKYILAAYRAAGALDEKVRAQLPAPRAPHACMHGCKHYWTCFMCAIVYGSMSHQARATFQHV